MPPSEASSHATGRRSANIALHSPSIPARDPISTTVVGSGGLQFVSSDYIFPDNNHPFPFPTTRTYTNITTNQPNQNFIGIKLGDVNGSWDANTP